ncbi:hypothetical protein CFB81_33435 [Burkholderia sp. AU28863]|nr:hypothetical protein CFB81_33435 [Burkholderia sp. AU28863]
MLEFPSHLLFSRWRDSTDKSQHIIFKFLEMRFWIIVALPFLPNSVDMFGKLIEHFIFDSSQKYLSFVVGEDVQKVIVLHNASVRAFEH